MTKENFVNENKPFKTNFKLARLIVKKYGLKSKVVLSKRSGTSKGDYGGFTGAHSRAPWV